MTKFDGHSDGHFEFTSRDRPSIQPTAARFAEFATIITAPPIPAWAIASATHVATSRPAASAITAITITAATLTTSSAQHVADRVTDSPPPPIYGSPPKIHSP